MSDYRKSLELLYLIAEVREYLEAEAKLFQETGKRSHYVVADGFVKRLREAEAHLKGRIEEEI